VYTVKQISDLAGVSVRTLHYYDEIGLLKPATVGENGYRYYGEESLFALQQILFFREMDLGLLQIKDIIHSPSFDLLAALRQHRDSLEERIGRLRTLIQTVDSTIMHMAGELTVSKKSLFAGFSEDKQKEYEREIAEKHQDWDQNAVRESQRRWKSYTVQDKQKIGEEGMAVYSDLIAAMGRGPESAEVQAIIARWHQHLRYFYEPTIDIMRGLGQMYNEHPDFNANFRELHPDLPEFLSKAIGIYVDRLAK
jgi:DNA-binding transcriptional MerR regulator